ncbi:MAG: hypothetical protein CMC35_01235 [Flavobacteriaceae bacterium]|nr:hypothetical protein [Flavobacteriaceae bacterium]|tara:strand:+ start:28756 stop:29259 length:504 start_codon:yes stop_codon:yes gene_type:complete
MKEQFKHRKSGFSVPDMYFDTLEERLQGVASEEVFSKEKGFKTPEGYFNTLEERIIARSIPSEKDTPVRVLNRSSWWRYAAAAAVVAFIVAIWTQNNTSETSVDTIEFTSIENYLEEGYISWDTEDITSMATSDSWDDIEWDASHVSEEQIETYLLDHIEPNTLIIE